MNVAPRPRSFRVLSPDGWLQGWLTFTEGVTDIPSVLDRVWRLAHERHLPIVVLDATMIAPRNDGDTMRKEYDFDWTKARRNPYKFEPPMIYTPWTAEQVAGLNRHQMNPAVHPYTCGQCGAVLVATAEGWSCVSGKYPCNYTQKWALASSVQAP